MNAATFIKNAANSGKYLAIDVAADLNKPAIDFGKDVKDNYKSFSDSLKEAKSNINFKAKLRNYKKIGKDAGKSIASDFQKGKFYNKDKQNQVEKEQENAMMKQFGFDDSDFDFNLDFDDNFDLDSMDNNFEDDEKSSSTSSTYSRAVDNNSRMQEASAKYIAKYMNKSISDHIASSAKISSRTSAYIASTIQESTVATITTMNDGFSSVVKGLGVINNNLELFKDTTLKLQESMQNSAAFYTGFADYQQKSLKFLEEIAKNTGPHNSKSKAVSKDEFSIYNLTSNGLLDIGVVANQVDKSIKEIKDMGDTLFGLFKMMFPGEITGKTLATMGLKAGAKAGLSALLGKRFNDAVKNFYEGLGGAVAVKAYKFGNLNGPLGILTSILGLNPTDNYQNAYSTSRYEKGRVDWDGKSRKALMEVIPTQLAQIVSLLSGKEERIYDYETGRWKTLRTVKKEFKSEKQRYARNNEGDFISNMKDSVNNLKDQDFKQKEIDEIKQGIDEFNYQVYHSGKLDLLNPDSSEFKKAIFSKNAKTNRAIKQYLRAYIRKSKIDTPNAALTYEKGIITGREDYGDFMRRTQAEGGSIYDMIFNGYDKDQKNSSTPTIFGKDNLGNGALFYLSGIFESSYHIASNLAFLRGYSNVEYGTPAIKNGKPGQNHSLYRNRKYIDDADTTTNKKKNRFNPFGKNHKETGTSSIKTQNTISKEKAPTLDSKFNGRKLSTAGRTKTFNIKASDVKRYNTFESFVKAKYPEAYKYYVAKNKGQKVESNPVFDKGLSQLEEWYYNGMTDNNDFGEAFGKKFTINTVKDNRRKHTTELVPEYDDQGNLTEDYITARELEMLMDHGQKQVADYLKHKINKDGTFVENEDYEKTLKKFKIVVETEAKAKKAKGTGVGKKAKGYADNVSDKYNKVKNDEFTKSVTNFIRTPFNAVADLLDAATNSIDKAINGSGSNAGDGIKDLLFGEGGWLDTAIKKIPFGEAIANAINNFKNTKVGQETKEAFGKIKDFLFGNFGSFEYIKNQTMQEDLNALMEEEKKKESKVQQAYRGRARTKRGYAAVSKGELIVPAEYNPFYGSYAEGGTAGKGKTKKQPKGLAGAIQKLVFKAITKLGVGGTELYGNLNPDKSEDDIEADKKKAKEAVTTALDEMGQHRGSMVAGAIMGGATSLLTGALLGPIAGLAIGAGTGLVASSEKVQKALFGEDIKDENGKVTGKKGGILNEKISTFITKHVPEMGKGAGIGATAGLFFGSPIIGAIIGTSIGYVKTSEKAQKFLFGTPDDPTALGKFKEQLKKKIGPTAAGALIGATVGPFGLIGNLIIGSAIGFVSGEKGFKNYFFGEINEKTGKREGGIAGIIKDKIATPIVGIVQKTSENIKNTIRDTIHAVTRIARKIILSRIVKRVKNSSKTGILGKLLNGIGKLSEVMLLRLPGGILSTINNRKTRKAYKKGTAIRDEKTGKYKLAGERLEGGEQFGYANTVSGQFDQAMAAANKDQLSAMQKALEIRYNPEKEYGKAIRQSGAKIGTELQNAEDKFLADPLLSKKAQAAKRKQLNKIRKLINKGKYTLAIQEINKSEIDENSKKAILDEVNNIIENRSRIGASGEEARTQYIDFLDKNGMLERDDDNNLVIKGVDKKISDKILNGKLKDSQIANLLEKLNIEQKGRDFGAEAAKTKEEKKDEREEKQADSVEEIKDGVNKIVEKMTGEKVKSDEEKSETDETPEESSNSDNVKDISEASKITADHLANIESLLKAIFNIKDKPKNADETASDTVKDIIKGKKEEKVEEETSGDGKTSAGEATSNNDDKNEEKHYHSKLSKSKMGNFAGEVKSAAKIVKGAAQFVGSKIMGKILGAANGTRQVTKTGVVAVSKGEMIVPSELNPFYHGITNKAQQKRDEANSIKKFYGSFADGTESVDGEGETTPASPTVDGAIRTSEDGKKQIYDSDDHSWHDDNSDTETKKINQEEEVRNTNIAQIAPIRATVSLIYQEMLNMQEKMIGNETDQNPGLLGALANFFTGNKGGLKTLAKTVGIFKLFDLLKGVALGYMTTKAVTGGYDTAVAQMVDNSETLRANNEQGTYVASDKETETYKDSDGKIYVVKYDENGNPYIEKETPNSSDPNTIGKPGSTNYDINNNASNFAIYGHTNQEGSNGPARQYIDKKDIDRTYENNGLGSRLIHNILLHGTNSLPAKGIVEAGRYINSGLGGIPGVVGEKIGGWASDKVDSLIKSGASNILNSKNGIETVSNGFKSQSAKDLFENAVGTIVDENGVEIVDNASETMTTALAVVGKQGAENVVEDVGEDMIVDAVSSSVVKETGTELGKFATALSKIPFIPDTVITHIDDLINMIKSHIDDALKALSKDGLEGVKNALKKAAKAVAIAIAVIDGINAWQEAESILGIDANTYKATTMQRVMATIITLLNDVCPVIGGIIPSSILVNIIMAFAKKIGLDKKDQNIAKLEEQREATSQTVKEFNEKNGTNYTIAQYNKINGHESIFHKIGDKATDIGKGIIHTIAGKKFTEEETKEYNLTHGTNYTVDQLNQIKGHNGIIANTKNLVETAKDKVVGVGQTVGGAIGTAAGFVANKAGQAKDFIVDKTGQAKDFMADKIGDMKSGFSYMVSLMQDQANYAESLLDSTTSENSKDNFKKFVDFKDLKDSNGNPVTGVVKAFAVIARSVVFAQHLIQAIGNKVGSVITSLVKDIGSDIGVLGDNVKTQFSYVPSGDIMGLIQQENGKTSSILGWLVNSLSGTVRMISVPATAISWAGHKVYDGITSLARMANISTLVSNVQDQFSYVASGDIMGIINQKNVIDKSNPLSYFTTALSNVVKHFIIPITAVSWAGHKVYDGISKFVSMVANDFSTLGSSISDQFGYVSSGDPSGLLGYQTKISKSNPLSFMITGFGQMTKMFMVPASGISWVGHKIYNFFNSEGGNILNDFGVLGQSLANIGGIIKSGDIGSLNNYTPQEGSGGILDKVLQGIAYSAHFLAYPATTVSWTGHQIYNTVANIVNTIRDDWGNFSSNIGKITSLSVAGDISGLNNFEITESENNPLNGFARFITQAVRIANYPIAIVPWTGKKIVSAVSNLIDSVGDDVNTFDNELKVINEYADKGEPGKVIGDNAEFKSPLIGKFFSLGFTISKGFLSIKALLMKLVNFIPGVISGIGNSVFNFVTQNDNNTTTTTAGSGSGIHYTGGSSGFVSQTSSAYANRKIGNTTVGDNGCGPASAVMALNAAGAHSDMNSAINQASHYQTAGGTDITYFKDIFNKNGVPSNYVAGQSLVNSVASGRPTVLLGRDPYNVSKANSPFGPKSHYVVASGLNKDGTVNIKDPELKRTAKYNANILKNVQIGVTAGSGSGLPKYPRGYATRVLAPYFAAGGTPQREKIWDYLRSIGFTEVGAAGVMGCWEAESHNSPDSLEADYLYPGLNYADVMKDSASLDAYTVNKVFPRYHISINKKAYKGTDGHYYPGVGLAAWTGPKGQRLFDFAKQNGKDWTKLGTQLAFFTQDEKSNKYSSKLAGVSDPVQAAKNFYLMYEMPGDKSFKYFSKRGTYASQIYAANKGKNYGTDLNALDAGATGSSAAGISSDSSSSASSTSTSSSSSGGNYLEALSSIFTNVLNVALGGSNTSTDASTSTTGSSSDGTVEGTGGNYTTGNGLNNIAVAIMKDLVTNPSHGYSQPNRRGQGGYYTITVNGKQYQIRNGDRDCSSSVADAWATAGVPVPRDNYTGAMPGTFTKTGKFVAKPMSFASQIQPGDVLLKSGHTEMYIGNGQNAGFHSTYGHPEVGDQSGKESSITAFNPSKWSTIIHYTGGNSGLSNYVKASELGIPLSGSGTRYNLSEDELVKLASVCYREQGTPQGAAAEASLIANRYELYGQKKYSSLLNYVLHSGWFASSSTGSVISGYKTVYDAVKDVLVNGNRTLPLCVDEHDCFSDIRSISTGSVRDRSAYVKNQTIIKNRYGSTYTFYCFPASNSDPFGYTAEGLKRAGGSVVDPGNSAVTTTSTTGDTTQAAQSNTSSGSNWMEQLNSIIGNALGSVISGLGNTSTSTDTTAIDQTAATQEDAVNQAMAGSGSGLVEESDFIADKDSIRTKDGRRMHMSKNGNAIHHFIVNGKTIALRNKVLRSGGDSGIDTTNWRYYSHGGKVFHAPAGLLKKYGGAFDKTTEKIFNQYFKKTGTNSYEYIGPSDFSNLNIAQDTEKWKKSTIGKVTYQAPNGLIAAYGDQIDQLRQSSPSQFSKYFKEVPDKSSWDAKTKKYTKNIYLYNGATDYKSLNNIDFSGLNKSDQSKWKKYKSGNDIYKAPDGFDINKILDLQKKNANKFNKYFTVKDNGNGKYYTYQGPTDYNSLTGLDFSSYYGKNVVNNVGTISAINKATTDNSKQLAGGVASIMPQIGTAEEDVINGGYSKPATSNNTKTGNTSVATSTEQLANSMNADTSSSNTPGIVSTVSDAMMGAVNQLANFAGVSSNNTGIATSNSNGGSTSTSTASNNTANSPAATGSKGEAAQIKVLIDLVQMVVKNTGSINAIYTVLSQMNGNNQSGNTNNTNLFGDSSNGEIEDSLKSLRESVDAILAS